MPRENRYARSNAQFDAPRSASVKTQMVPRGVPMIDRRYTAVDELRDSIGDFFGRAHNAIDTAMSARAKQLRDVDEGLANQAFTDFAMGKSIDEVDERKRTNKAYVNAFQTLSASRNAIELATEFKQSVSNWSPEEGSLRDIRDRFLQENLKGADELGFVYNEKFVTKFLGMTDSIVAQGGELLAAEVDRKNRVNFAAKAGAMITNTDTPPTVEDFLELDAELDAVTPFDDRTRIATIFTHMKNAAAGGTPEDRQRFLGVMTTLPLGENGKTFADLFPKEHDRYVSALNEELYKTQAAGAQSAFSDIVAQAHEFALANDWQAVEDNVYPAYLAAVDRYGDGPHAAAAKERLTTLLSQMGEKAATAHAIAEELRGVNTGMQPKELREAVLAETKRLGVDLNSQSPTEELEQRSIGTANIMSQLYLGRGEVPDVLTKPIEGMLGAGKSASLDHQMAALSSLRRLDKLSRGGTAVVLKDNAYASAVWDMMKDVDDDEAQRMFSAMNENPDVFNKMLAAPLWEVMGIEPKSTDRADVRKAEDDALKALSSSKILKAMGAGQVESLNWDGQVGSLLKNRIKFRYAMAAAQGMPVSDHEEVAVQAAASIRDSVSVTPMSYNSGGLDLFFDDTKWRVELKSRVETIQADPGYMNIRDELQQGVPGGKGESLRDNIEADLDAASGAVEDVGFSVHQGEWADANFFTVKVADGAVGIPVDVRFSAQPGMDNSLFGKALTFTGNPDDDAAEFRRVADEIGLPAGFELLPVRNSVRNGKPGQYMLAYRPPFRDPRAKENKTLEQKAKEWEDRKATQSKAVVNESLDRFRATQQASGEIRPSIGLTNFSMDEVLNQGPLAGLNKLLTEKRLNPHRPPLAVRNETAEVSRFIRANEGVPHKRSYDDQGDRSIGYGFNLTQNKELFLKTLGLTERDYEDAVDGRLELTPLQINKLHEAAVIQFEKQVDQWYKDVDLRAHERTAIVSLAFNNPSMISPKTRFFKAVKEGDTAAAIKEILYRSNASKLKGLFTRRYAEALMFAGDASLVPTHSEYKAQVGS